MNFIVDNTIFSNEDLLKNIELNDLKIKSFNKDYDVIYNNNLEQIINDNYLKNDFILIGSSLGGIFLAKYLSENKLKKKAVATYLVCPPFDNSLTGEDLVGGFKLKSDLSLLEENSKNTHLFFSEDDDVVPVSHAEKYKKKLKNANIVIFKSKNGHFNISTFPEIVKIIKDDVLN